MVLSVSACRSDEKTESESSGPLLAAEAGPGPEITTIGFSREDTVLHYTLDIRYPAIRGEEVFNDAVRANLEKAINEFTTFIQDFHTEGRVMRSEFQLVQNTSLVTSVRQMYEWAVPGTSTLQYRFYNVNFSPEAREIITLGSLFKEGKDYRELLAKRLSERIRARFKVEVEVTPEDLETFVIGPGYLEFYKVLYPEVMDPEPKAFQVQFSELERVLK